MLLEKLYNRLFCKFESIVRYINNITNCSREFRELNLMEHVTVVLE